MKNFLITLTILNLALANCGKNESEEVEETPTWLTAKQKAQGYEQNIERAQDAYGFIGVRCDSLTFSSLVSAFSDLKIDLHKAEKTPGKWYRHVNQCYPDHSRSQTTKDAYLQVLHWLLSRWNKGDQSAKTDLEEIIAHGEANNWISGEGDTGSTDLKALLPFIGLLADKMGIGSPMPAQLLDGIPVIESHNGHLIALGILLHGRISGSINSVELAALKALVLGAPSNPIYRAIYSRFSGGDYSRLIEIVSEQPDEIPIYNGAWGWGSAPAFMFIIVAIGIAEGR